MGTSKLWHRVVGASGDDDPQDSSGGEPGGWGLTMQLCVKVMGDECLGNQHVYVADGGGKSLQYFVLTWWGIGVYPHQIADRVLGTMEVVTHLIFVIVDNKGLIR